MLVYVTSESSSYPGFVVERVDCAYVRMYSMYFYMRSFNCLCVLVAVCVVF